MNTDPIEAIGIDERGSLWVKPQTVRLRYIYREAMEVSWDEKRLCLYGPPPREWTYLKWFQHIRRAAREQSVALVAVPTTTWHNIDDELRSQMSSDVAPD